MDVTPWCQVQKWREWSRVGYFCTKISPGVHNWQKHYLAPWSPTPNTHTCSHTHYIKAHEAPRVSVVPPHQVPGARWQHQRPAVRMLDFPLALSTVAQYLMSWQSSSTKDMAEMNYSFLTPLCSSQRLSPVSDSRIVEMSFCHPDFRPKTLFWWGFQVTLIHAQVSE